MSASVGDPLFCKMEVLLQEWERLKRSSAFTSHRESTCWSPKTLPRWTTLSQASALCVREREREKEGERGRERERDREEGREREREREKGR